jgi:hypothetical protein
MGKRDEYRHAAATTIDLAKRAATSDDKGRLLALAAKWLDLADRVQGMPSCLPGPRLPGPRLLAPLN